ncbi:glycerophosphoryl diester phosphodiesterase [Naviculisporaceae sp. PSN 640]
MLHREDGTPLPDAIAHRGYKAAYPENTMAAFEAAVQVGAHAIETDLHLSKDGVVMLSHDATLKRCFGVDKKVAESDSSYLTTLKSLRQPHQPMPRLSDLLHFIGRPENESVWLLLDVKTDDDPEELLSKTAETIASVPTSRPWKERVVLGGWNKYYLDLCKKLFPGFTIANIGFLPYAFKYLKEERDIDFNILQPTLLGPAGKHFIRKVKKLQRKLYVWTVNEEHWMEWSIRKKVDGVITDDPKLFLEVCERFSLEGSQSRGGGEGGELVLRTGPSTMRRAKLYLTGFMFQMVVFSLTFVFWRRVAKIGMKRAKVQTREGVPVAA